MHPLVIGLIAVLVIGLSLLGLAVASQFGYGLIGALAGLVAGAVIALVVMAYAGR